MRKILMAAVMAVGLMGAECVLVHEPEPPGWEDPQTVVALVDAIFGHLNDLVAQAQD